MMPVCSGNPESQLPERLNRGLNERLCKNSSGHVLVIIRGIHVPASTIGDTVENPDSITEQAFFDASLQLHSHIPVRHELGGIRPLREEITGIGLQPFQSDWLLEF